MIVVERAPPYLTVQDSGRTGHRAKGVPRCGAMDQWSYEAANRIVGNERNAAALEWAVAGGALRFETNAVMALTGAEAEASIDGIPIRAHTSLPVSAGQRLEIHRLVVRRFLYVSIRGGVDCPPILGSRSTYLTGAFGGLGGRSLAKGVRIPIVPHAYESTAPAGQPRVPAPDYDAETIRVVPATENLLNLDFTVTESPTDNDDAFARFLNGTYTISPASDRTGYRLDGGRSLEQFGASITSRPLCPGTIQLPPGGQPIVLMADSPTIGGYKILGTVISRDLPIVAQSMTGRVLRFEQVSAETARAIVVRRESFEQHR